MSDAKRSWFQIHLSTAVLLKMVAAFLLWLNIKSTDVRFDLEPSVYKAPGFPVTGRCIKRGWASTAYFSKTEWEHHPPTLDRYISMRHREGIKNKGLTLNTTVAFAILTAVVVGCEWWVRRRRRKMSV